jgi:prepilin-type N-terminal cleavage/methylation domain-containing protein
MMKKEQRPGFTILEIAIVITILSILLTMTLFVSFDAISRTGLRSAENVVVQMMRRAQTQSQNNVSGSQWGVYICEGNPVQSACSGKAAIVTYERDEFDTQDADDSVFEINPNIVFTGTLYDKIRNSTEGGGSDDKGITFTRFTGDPLKPTFSGTIIMTLNDEVRTVSVNGKGIVER